ncbi:hypothetical protein KI387_040412, partial [Taxus chinensis]
MGEAITGTGVGRPHFSNPGGDFIGPVEIRMTSNGCGRGLFATEDIETAQALLISRALALSHKSMEDPIKDGLLQNVKDAPSSCGDHILKLFLSHRSCELIPKMTEFFNLSEENKDSEIDSENKSISEDTDRGYGSLLVIIVLLLYLLQT